MVYKYKYDGFFDKFKSIKNFVLYDFKDFFYFIFKNMIILNIFWMRSTDFYLGRLKYTFEIFEITWSNKGISLWFLRIVIGIWFFYSWGYFNYDERFREKWYFSGFLLLVVYRVVWLRGIKWVRVSFSCFYLVLDFVEEGLVLIRLYRLRILCKGR